MKGRPQAGRRAAFSLVEVLLAVGVLAGAVVAAAAVFGPASRASRDARDRQVALRLSAPTIDALQRLRREAGRFEDFAARTGDPIELVADEAGLVVEPLATTTLPPARRYFRLEASRVIEPQHQPGRGAVLLRIRVAWPYVVPGSEQVAPPAFRTEWSFIAAVGP